jgi:hypothetical protein
LELLDLDAGGVTQCGGAVAEFGMFKGDTTMFLSRIIERLGADWPVIGFDTFDGFPPRRSPLDMYDHPDCVFTDLPGGDRHAAHRGWRRDRVRPRHRRRPIPLHPRRTSGGTASYE